MSIHKNAFIDPSAKLGKDVVIDAFAVIGPNSIIGDRCHIRSHAVVQDTELGEECVVYPQANLGLEPQHIKDKGENTKVKVGKKSIFREGVTVHRGTNLDKGVTQIGDNCFFMVYSHIAHDCIVEDEAIITNAAQIAGHVQIGKRAYISTMVGLHQFIRVGEGALVSGGSMVPMDVAPFCIAQGDRSYLRGLNIVGMRRAGFDRTSIRLIKSAYATVFTSGLKLEEALKHADLNNSNPHVKTFKDFLSEKARGFVRPNTGKVGKETKEEVLA